MAERTYRVQGMHCASCEVLVERAFRQLPNVSAARANQARGVVAVACDGEPDVARANERLAPHGYLVLGGAAALRSGFRRLGGIVLLTTVVYVLFRQLNLAPNVSGGADLSLGFVFLMGLVAAVSSCIAVTGGLLVAVSTAHAQAHPEETGWQKFKPHLFFNVGRITSYTVLGAAVGALGSVLALSYVASGVVTLIASLAMIVLGLRLLHVSPWLSRLTLRPPRAIAHRLYDAAGNPRPWAPFLMGAGTFFLPCGFTQALQLYVLTRGDAAVGAATMLVFSLGTLPALLGLGAITSFVRGRWQRVVATVAGAAVMALGFINLGNGLTLTGVNAMAAGLKQRLAIAASGQGIVPQDPNVTLENGVQVVRMQVDAHGYSPNHFYIRAGLPVRWDIQGVNTYGCQSILVAPTVGVNTFVRPGQNLVEFTPRSEGTIPFSCGMGMYRGSFTVLAAPGGKPAPPAVPPPTGGCDRTIMNCSS